MLAPLREIDCAFYGNRGTDLFTLCRATPEWSTAIADFLLEVFAPLAPHKPNHAKVRAMVPLVIERHCALMILDGERIISSIGLIPMAYWWCDQHVVGNVWFSTRQCYSVGDILVRKVARMIAPVELHIQSEPRGTLSIFNNPGWK